MQVMQISIHDSDISSSSIKPHEGASMSLGNGVASSSSTVPPKINLLKLILVLNYSELNKVENVLC